jgi:hypothetical protein
MPVYKVKPETDYPITAAPGKGEKNKKRYPSVTIPVSPEIIAALEVGGRGRGDAQGQGARPRVAPVADNDPYSNRNELRLELRTVEAYPDEAPTTKPEEAEEPTMKDAIDKGLGYSK